MVWMLVMVVVVIGIKYYTATRMRDLERRLNEVKDGLHEKKQELDRAMGRQAEVQTEEDHGSERIRSMKELINDIQIRLTTADEPESSELVIDSGSPPGIM